MTELYNTLQHFTKHTALQQQKTTFPRRHQQLFFTQSSTSLYKTQQNKLQTYTRLYINVHNYTKPLQNFTNYTRLCSTTHIFNFHTRVQNFTQTLQHFANTTLQNPTQLFTTLHNATHR